MSRAVVSFLLALGVSVGQEFTGPSLCTDNSTVGYSDISTIRNDLMAAEHNFSVSSNISFVLCPFTEFSFAKERGPLLIRTSGFRLQCGNDGTEREDCIFRDGIVHIWIEGEVVGVEIHGLKFFNSTYSSVVINTGQGSSVAFRNCQWEVSKLKMNVHLVPDQLLDHIYIVS